MVNLPEGLIVARVSLKISVISSGLASLATAKVYVQPWIRTTIIHGLKIPTNAQGAESLEVVSVFVSSAGCLLARNFG